jgi:hypothetical protein
MSLDTALYEAFELWPAWGVLCEHLTTLARATADPRSVYASALAAEYPRLVALLYGHGHGEDLEDAEQTLLCLLALAAEGRRPRYGAELLGVL